MKMSTYKVPYGLIVSVTIRREGETCFIDVHAPMYINKEWTLPHQYATTFTDDQILRDHSFVTQMINRYGV